MRRALNVENNILPNGPDYSQTGFHLHWLTKADERVMTISPYLSQKEDLKLSTLK
jgi:hypothetical protein